jgi:integrase
VAKAGLPAHCTSHGLRKAAAERCAEAGATVNQLMAIFGWKDPEMAIHYTKKADAKRMAQAAAHMMMASRGGEVIPAPSFTVRATVELSA